MPAIQGKPESSYFHPTGHLHNNSFTKRTDKEQQQQRGWWAEAKEASWPREVLFCHTALEDWSPRGGETSDAMG